MLKPILFALSLALPGGAALAQSDTGGAGTQGTDGTTEQRAPEPPQARPGMGEGHRPGMGGGHGRDMGGGGHAPGMEMMRAHHPDMAMMMGGGSKGFVLDLGDERSLRVNCGDETMAECLEAMRPIIDQMPSLSN